MTNDGICITKHDISAKRDWYTGTVSGGGKISEAQPDWTFTTYRRLPPPLHTYKTEVMKMNSIRCKHCGLSNFPDASSCKRCGSSIRKAKSNANQNRHLFSIISLLIFAIVAAIVYYAVGGFERSMDGINANEANRAAANAKDNPNGLSRTEYDRQRAGKYAIAVQNSNNLSQAQRHNQEIENLAH